MIEVEHAAESLPLHHETGRRRNVAHRFDETIHESLVIPLSVIVRGILSQQLAKMMLAERNHFRQALFANRTHEAPCTAPCTSIPTTKRCTCAQSMHSRRLMLPMPTPRRRYDHRIRNAVVEGRDLAVVEKLSIPASTRRSWRRRGAAPVVTLHPRDAESATSRSRSLGWSAVSRACSRWCAC